MLKSREILNQAKILKSRIVIDRPAYTFNHIEKTIEILDD